MDVTASLPATVPGARDLAQTVLSGLTDRWRHTIQVARRAEDLAAGLAPADQRTLLAAAWLHDIGYAEALVETGFHPLDGARFLGREGWPARLCSLVAHHSGARFVAAARGLAGELRAYREERSAVADALTYADQITGPRGERLTIEQRLADMLRRHGPDSAQARAHERRAPYLRAVAARVQQRQAARR
jgi:putative nucleotidyltransferase with HDIG domain